MIRATRGLSFLAGAAVVSLVLASCGGGAAPEPAPLIPASDPAPEVQEATPLPTPLAAPTVNATPGIAAVPVSAIPTIVSASLAPIPTVGPAGPVSAQATAGPVPSAAGTSASPSAAPATAAASAAPVVAPAAAPPSLTATISPARDLTATWRGGIAADGYISGVLYCKWTGSIVLDLKQEGSGLTGTADITWLTFALQQPYGTCQLAPQRYGVTGTVSASAATFTFDGAEELGVARGSFVTDLAYVTFSGTGDIRSQGCIQVSRVGVGALPSCR